MASSGLRFRLVGTVLVAIVPPLAAMCLTGTTWLAWTIAILAGAAAAWGIHHFLLRDLQTILKAAAKLRDGELSARAAFSGSCAELGKLTAEFNQMAESLESRSRLLEDETRRSLNRALQQAAVAALGQCALSANDLSSLLSQTVNLVTQTLEVPFCRILERQADGKSMLLRAGAGWRKGVVGVALIDADARSQAGFTLHSGEPAVVPDVRRDVRFSNDPLLGEHRVISAVSVAISGHGETYGVLAIYTHERREFTNDEIQFLLSISNTLATAIEHGRSVAELNKVADFSRMNPNPAVEFSENGAITYANDAAKQLAQKLGKETCDALFPPDVFAAVRACLASGQAELNQEHRVDGHVLSVSLHPLVANRVVHCYVTDVTDRLNLEEQLRQSQKMESIGQLAAGVAHDFNNMLTVIQGHAGLLMTRTGLSPDLRDPVQAVSFAAERAASLTRQLLMFSRKSVMQAKFLDMRDVVSSMVKLLKRILGEGVSLEFQPPNSLAAVHADPAMIEQVVMNLAVNARDAMAMGGRLVIELDDVSFQAGAPQGRAGEFVRMRVSDTGHGMKPETLARIFEPFFTTKPAGKGTGLGLATIYGIAKQHKGWVEVRSQYGSGTTFEVFVPADRQASACKNAGSPVEVRGGTETILLVEDEASVLALGRMMLQDCGYNVITAESGLDALEVWNRYEGRIDMLLTDMVMPYGVSGLDLAEQLAAADPDLNVLFTSGYCVDQFDTDLFKHDAGLFLQKPYTRTTLARAIRARLDQGGRLFRRAAEMDGAQPVAAADQREGAVQVNAA